MKVSIVIPTYNHYNLLHQCLFDVYRNCINADEVLVVNDSSTDEEVYSGLDWWKGSGMLNIREVRTAENRGFLRSSNIGLRKANGEVKILLSNDVRIYGDLLSAVLSILKDDPNHLIGGVIHSHDTGWNTFNGKIYRYVEGWLLATTSENWERLGYFDEMYAPNDFEDVDLSTTAVRLGIKLASLPPGLVEHMGAQSIGYTDKRRELTEENKKKFEAKWTK